MTQWRNLATVVIDLIQLHMNISIITRVNAMFRSISPYVFVHKGIPVGIEPTTETETLVFTLNYKANLKS